MNSLAFKNDTKEMNTNQQYEDEIRQDLKSVSKVKIEQWRNKALNNMEYFKAAIKIGLSDEKPYSWRCGWIISKVAEKNTSLIEPFIGQIIKSLNSFRYDSQIGGFLKALTYVQGIEADLLGILADYCIKIIFDTQRPSHNKYYAMQLLVGIAKKFPDLSREFILVIQENMPYYEKNYLKKYATLYIQQLAELSIK
jgi:hypothetical protein